MAPSIGGLFYKQENIGFLELFHYFGLSQKNNISCLHFCLQNSDFVNFLLEFFLANSDAIACSAWPWNSTFFTTQRLKFCQKFKQQSPKNVIFLQKQDLLTAQKIFLSTYFQRKVQQTSRMQFRENKPNYPLSGARLRSTLHRVTLDFYLSFQKIAYLFSPDSWRNSAVSSH